MWAEGVCGGRECMGEGSILEEVLQVKAYVDRGSMWRKGVHGRRWYIGRGGLTSEGLCGQRECVGEGSAWEKVVCRKRGSYK